MTHDTGTRAAGHGDNADDDTRATRVSAPYGDTANAYYTAGWRGVLPLPPGTKTPPPGGYTGAGGAWPSGADVWTWAEDHATGNICLRMPPDVIGIDVDAYDDKHGAQTFAEANNKNQPLPPTWRSTSRGDRVSGIYLYRVPPGLAWPGELGPGVEIIQTRHRYAVAPPSVHPSTGRRYRWITPDGDTAGDGRVPNVDELPDLPQDWIDALTGGRIAVDTTKATVDANDYTAWSTQNAHHGAPCGIVRVAKTRAINDMRDATASRHDTGLRAAMHLARLSTEGHTGCGTALDALAEAFISSITTGAAARTTEAGQAEWARIYNGALAVIAADGQLAACDLPDPCAHPLAGILPAQHLHEPARTDVTSPYSGGAHDRYTPPVIDGDDTANADAAFAAEVARERFRLDVRDTARRELAEQRERQQWPGMPVSYDLRSLLELDMPDPEWTIDALLPAGGNVVVVAAAKAGKTTTVNDIVRSLVDDRPVFGRYGVRFATGTCHLWNYEVGGGMYRQWLRDVGIDNDDRVHVMNLRGRRVPLSVDMIKNETIGILQASATRAWVLDPFARALIGNALSENDNSEVSAFLDVLDEIKEIAGVEHLIIPTHASRMDTTPGAERSRGASRLEDWADVRWYLSRDSEGARFFRASGRDVETEEEMLVMDPVTRRLHLQAGERADAAGHGDKKERISDGELQKLVLDAVRDCPGVGVRGLRRAVTDRRAARVNRIDDAVSALASQGVIVVRDGTNRMQEHWLPAQLSASEV